MGQCHSWHKWHGSYSPSDGNVFFLACWFKKLGNFLKVLTFRWSQTWSLFKSVWYWWCIIIVGIKKIFCLCDLVSRNMYLQNDFKNYIVVLMPMIRKATWLYSYLESHGWILLLDTWCQKSLSLRVCLFYLVKVIAEAFPKESFSGSEFQMTEFIDGFLWMDHWWR